MKRKERNARMPKTENVAVVIPKHPRLYKRENRDKTKLKNA